MSEFKYVGSELDLFAAVRNWKSYWSHQIRPFVTGDVVEVGAGIGSNTSFLDPGGRGRWVCLEPDAELIGRLTETLRELKVGRSYEPVCGTLQSLDGQKFDTIIYIDVLEHIEHDREEMIRAATHLKPGGHVIVLSPAHQRLFTPFDASIGHYRRYDRPMMLKVSPDGLRLRRLRYLDAVGMFASAANLLFLRQSMPTAAQLQLWDRWMVPVSRLIDPFFGYSVGKTIIGIWQKSA